MAAAEVELMEDKRLTEEFMGRIGPSSSTRPDLRNGPLIFRLLRALIALQFRTAAGGCPGSGRRQDCRSGTSAGWRQVSAGL
jgi:hypothetical protein